MFLKIMRASLSAIKGNTIDCSAYAFNETAIIQLFSATSEKRARYTYTTDRR